MTSFIKQLVVLGILMGGFMVLSLGALGGEKVIVGQLKEGYQLRTESGVEYQINPGELGEMLSEAVGKKIEVFGSITNNDSLPSILVKEFTVMD